MAAWSRTTMRMPSQKCCRVHSLMAIDTGTAIPKHMETAVAAIAATIVPIVTNASAEATITDSGTPVGRQEGKTTAVNDQYAEIVANEGATVVTDIGDTRSIATPPRTVIAQTPRMKILGTCPPEDGSGDHTGRHTILPYPCLLRCRLRQYRASRT